MNDQPLAAALPASRSAGLPVRRVTISDIASMNLGTFRKAAGLTQAELGERIGWGKTVVSTAERSWEAARGRNFSADDLVLIADALGIPAAALLLPPEDDGIRYTYVLDEADDEPRSVKDLLFRVVHRDVPQGVNDALDTYRNRLAALGWRPPDIVAREDFEQQVGALTAKIADTGREVPECLEQYRAEMQELYEQRDRLAARVLDLRMFEREYRRRLQQYVEGAYHSLWHYEGGPGRAAVDEMLREVRERPGADGVTAVVLHSNGTYDTIHPAREAGDDEG